MYGYQGEGVGGMNWETGTDIDIYIFVCIYIYIFAKSLQSCLTLCDPIDSSPPGSTFPGILQARILEWVATSFSKYMCVCVCVYTIDTVYIK